MKIIYPIGIVICLPLILAFILITPAEKPVRSCLKFQSIFDTLNTLAFVSENKTNTLVYGNDPCDTARAKRVMGYRFIITGDFNGDKKTDTLIERFTDSTGKETNKYFEKGGDAYYSHCVEARRKTQHFFQVKGFSSDTLYCDHLCFAENLGDLDGDGADEIGFIGDNGDFSSLSSYHVYQLKKKKWSRLLRIPTWEWIFPPTPEVANTYYLFGHYNNKRIDSDTMNLKLENELSEFTFVKKLGGGWVEFYTRNDTLETYFYVGADQMHMRYHLATGKFKLKIPEDFARNPEIMEAIPKEAKVYRKLSNNEILIDDEIYYFE